MPQDLTFRFAQRADLPAIVHMLADDHLGSQRERYENPLPGAYYSAFEQINSDPNHELIVAERSGEVIGTLHLMFLPSISFLGGLRVQIESVRVDKRFQSQGIGSEMTGAAVLWMKWSMERARQRGAHRFYERLGFRGTHLGMKLSLK